MSNENRWPVQTHELNGDAGRVGHLENLLDILEDKNEGEKRPVKTKNRLKAATELGQIIFDGSDAGVMVWKKGKE